MLLLEDNEDLICRICLETDIQKNLISPCECKGSQKWVHYKCLFMWRTQFADNHNNALTCRECQTPYNHSYIQKIHYMFYILKCLHITSVLCTIFSVCISFYCFSEENFLC